jgi:hypothetical protein
MNIADKIESVPTGAKAKDMPDTQVVIKSITIKQ